MVIFVQVGQRLMKYDGMDQATVIALASEFGQPQLITEDQYIAALAALS